MVVGSLTTIIMNNKMAFQQQTDGNLNDVDDTFNNTDNIQDVLGQFHENQETHRPEFMLK